MLGHPLYQNQALTQLCLTPALIPVKPTLGFTLNINDEYTPHRQSGSNWQCESKWVIDWDLEIQQSIHNQISTVVLWKKMRNT